MEKAINISMFIFKSLPIRANREGVPGIELLVNICRLFLAEQTHLAALGIL